MTIYWTMRSVPELAGLSRRERGRTWRRHVLSGLKHWRARVGLLGMWGLMAVGIFAGSALFDPPTSIVFGAVCGGTGGFMFQQLLISAVRPYLRGERPTPQSSAAEPSPRS